MIKKPEGPFEIMINDYQRQLLIKVLSHMSHGLTVNLKNSPPDPSTGGLSDNALREAVCLRDMLKDLPDQNEASGPGESFPRRRTLHGFCL
jgi:hypothetical protein